jgi:hypothetical protein
MELAGPRRRRIVRLGGGLAFASVLCGAGVAAVGAGEEETLPAALLGAAAVACAWALYRCYAAREKP